VEVNTFCSYDNINNLILQEFQVETLGFEHLKEMYQEDPNFKEAYEACENRLI
jgi:hypothetical protein